MNTTQKTTQKSTKSARNSKKTALNTAKEGANVEVLYQKMGDRWFAFSVVDGEVFIGSIAQDKIDEIDRLEAEAAEAAARAGKPARTFSLNGNS
jgi:hypothetical protein